MSDAPRTIFRIPWLSEDVNPNFFDVLAIRIIEGRAFKETDNAQSEPVVILSESSAKGLFGSTKVIGRRIRFGENDGQWRTVVGVAANVYPIDPTSFSRQRLGGWGTGFAYRPLAQTAPEAADVDRTTMENGQFIGGRSGFKVLVRGSSIENASNTLSALLERVAPGEKLTVMTLEHFLDRTGQADRGQATMRLLLAFTMCGLALGLIGAMLLIDDVVRGRTNEFGIRRALGAPGANLVALAGRETLIAGVVGVSIGTALGARFGPYVSLWLRGAVNSRVLLQTPIDWTLVAGSISTLLVVLFLGTVARAVRAATLDPMVALRVE